MQKLTMDEKIERCIKRHPEWSDTRIANSTSCKISDLKRIRLGLSLPKSDESKKVGFISLKKVVERYDIKTAILKELAKLPRGQLIQENDLREMAAGNDRNRFRRTVENNMDEFRALRIKLKLDESSDGKYYWGHPDDVAEAQRIRDL